MEELIQKKQNPKYQKVGKESQGKLRASKISKAMKGKKHKIVQCPHCNKEGIVNMKRYHFNNCKTKITI